MRLIRMLTLITGVQIATTAAAAAQHARPDTAVANGTVLGTILDAATDEPLPSAVVLLEPGPGGAVMPVRGQKGGVEYIYGAFSNNMPMSSRISISRQSNDGETFKRDRWC